MPSAALLVSVPTFAGVIVALMGLLSKAFRGDTGRLWCVLGILLHASVILLSVVALVLVYCYTPYLRFHLVFKGVNPRRALRCRPDRPARAAEEF
jgi:hypothetical protein